jgi:hypothetical protein
LEIDCCAARNPQRDRANAPAHNSDAFGLPGSLGDSLRKRGAVGWRQRPEPCEQRAAGRQRALGDTHLLKNAVVGRRERHLDTVVHDNQQGSAFGHAFAGLPKPADDSRLRAA